MVLKKRYQTYYLDYYANGKRVRRTLRLHDKGAAEAVLATMKLAQEKKAAAEAIAAMLGSIYENARPKTGLPLSGAWETYITTAKAAGVAEVSADTLRKRRGYLQAFCDWVARDRPMVATVQDVDGSVAAAYATWLSAGTLAPKTRQMRIDALSIIWRILSKAVADVSNPWQGLRPRNVNTQRHPVFTPEKEARVLDCARKQGDGWPLMCLIARHTGLRYGDVATLRWEDVDMVRGVIDVTPRKTSAHGIRVLLPIERGALMPELAKARKSSSGKGWLFPRFAARYNTTGMAPKGSKFAQILEAAGLDPKDGYTFHCWRHTFRTRLAEAGVSTETAMRLCGHTDERTSAGYDHSQHLDELSAAIEAAAKVKAK